MIRRPVCPAGGAWLPVLIVSILVASLTACENHGTPFVPTRPGGIDSTKIEGRAVGNWVKSKSPYFVVGSARVPAGRTLTIEPGVIVVFIKKGLNLTVEGTLIAVGRADSMITFRPTSNSFTNPAPGDWGSLIFKSSRGNRLEYTNVLFGTTGIVGTDSEFLIRNSVFSRHQFDAFDLVRCSVDMTDCTISNNGVYGFLLTECDNPPHTIHLEHCNIGLNIFGGIRAVDSSVEVFRSDIMNNGVNGDENIRSLAAGIHFEGAPGQNLPIFTQCNIQYNKPCDLRNNMSEGRLVVADSTFWGAATTILLDFFSNSGGEPVRNNCNFNAPQICDATDSLGTAPNVTFCWWRDLPWCNFGPYVDLQGRCSPVTSPASNWDLRRRRYR